MDIAFINPFLEATVNVLQPMAFVAPKPGKPFLNKRDDPSQGDITGVVGMTGPVKGSIAVSFSEQAILHIVSNMLGEAFKGMNEEVKDAAGELSNMICGGARRALADNGHHFEACFEADSS